MQVSWKRRWIPFPLLSLTTAKACCFPGPNVPLLANEPIPNATALVDDLPTCQNNFQLAYLWQEKNTHCWPHFQAIYVSPRHRRLFLSRFGFLSFCFLCNKRYVLHSSKVVSWCDNSVKHHGKASTGGCHRSQRPKLLNTNRRSEQVLFKHMNIWINCCCHHESSSSSRSIIFFFRDEELGWMDDGTNDGTNGWEGRPTPDKTKDII